MQAGLWRCVQDVGRRCETFVVCLNWMTAFAGSPQSASRAVSGGRVSSSTGVSVQDRQICERGAEGLQVRQGACAAAMCETERVQAVLVRVGDQKETLLSHETLHAESKQASYMSRGRQRVRSLRAPDQTSITSSSGRSLSPSCPSAGLAPLVSCAGRRCR